MFDRALKILILSPEMVPFAKTGGLADVAGSLPKALATLQNGNDVLHDVRVAIPRYKQIEEASYLMDFPVRIAGRNATAVIRTRAIEAQYQGVHRNLPVYMVDNYHYFYRDGMYMFPDEAERFGFFCRAVLEMLPRLNWQPDLIHCNDWQTGLVPLLLKTVYQSDPLFKHIATVFTIHNLQYQGNFPHEDLELLGLDEEFFTPGRIEFYGTVSFMKAGIVYADVINTVSRTYAREIQTQELGERMDGILRMRANDLYGIVNGINYHEFNPKTDQRIYRNFDHNDIGGKKDNKYALQKEMGLPVRDVPVIGLISRLVDQKGLDIILEIINDLTQAELQLVVLGSGDPRYEKLFGQLRGRFPQKVGAFIAFNAILAQRIYAGSDMFLMPSRFEPCGLGQLISMRYGTVPIVRSTGGLADTVHDFNPATGSGNGFAFEPYTGEALLSTVQRALKLYREDPGQWEKLVRRVMELDYSWARSGVEYLQLFQEALRKHAGVKTMTA
ncbi:MAG: glycogen/starch synthase [Peptococcaceae bacterium]|jgi:starch synthase|nr:glycogen/starch synthase [Peptococcaceae bacterium]